ncbi:MAG: hypothetical protein AB1486_15185 [Planctomycetota bacterium]
MRISGRTASRALLVLASLAGVAWLVTRGGDDPERVPDREWGSVEGSLTAGAPPTGASPSTPERQEVAPVEEAAPVAAGLLVRVIREDTRERVPGAELSFVDLEKLGEKDREAWFREDEWLPEVSEPLLADDRGEVRLPAFPERALIVGRVRDGAEGELWGRLLVGAWDKEPVLLSLDSDRSLTVQVVDAGGQPLPGYPVALRSVVMGVDDAEYDLWQGLTVGPLGTLTIPHIHGSVKEGDDSYSVVLPILSTEERLIEIRLSAEELERGLATFR